MNIRKLYHLNTLLLYLALIFALLSSLSHVAFAFSTVNGANWTEAYLSAIAIDLGLLALAAGINKRKSERRGVKALWLGVGLFSVISIYANWLSGIGHVTPFEMDMSQVGAYLVSLRPILLSGVLPVLVIYLSEIVSGNHAVAQEMAHKEAKRQAKRVSNGQGRGIETQTTEERKAHLDTANDTRKSNAAERRLKVLELLSQEKTQRQIASELRVSLATVKRDTKSLNGDGAK
jgi:uncharacterized membrane protein